MQNSGGGVLMSSGSRGAPAVCAGANGAGPPGGRVDTVNQFPGGNMKLLSCAVLAAAVGFVPCAFANEPTEKDAVAMVEKGAAFMKGSGKDQMIKRINAKDPDFVQGPLYLTMRDEKGVILANPVNPAMIGKDLLDVPDPDGKLFRREILDLAKSKGKGWVDYKFKNPASGKVEAKTTYIYKVGDVTLEAGIYKK
jgi:cytochrome c